MLNKSSYEKIMKNLQVPDDFKEAFTFILNNPYRIIGASTFLESEQLEELYQKWQEDPSGYRSQFDKSKLGFPNRTQESMSWAVENADSYVYKLFWFSDYELSKKLGSKEAFLEFFSKKRDIENTDYNSFLAQYIFLCIYDTNFELVEQWKQILGLINDLLGISAGRFWAFFSGNNIESPDNNRMSFLYNEFKDNILYPVRSIINKKKAKEDLENIIKINTILDSVDSPKLPITRLKNTLYERIEKWFVKESEYVNNVLLSSLTSVSASSMEEKLAITNAYNYVVKELVPDFTKMIDNVIPRDHSMNTKLRMMFSGKFLVVAKILSNSELYKESLNLCKIFNELFSDEYLTKEIKNLDKILKQQELTSLRQNSTASVKGQSFLDNKEMFAPPAEYGELEALEKERRQQFFNKDKNRKKGIDYKDIIQEVIEREMKLVEEKDEAEVEKLPLIDRKISERILEEDSKERAAREEIERINKRHEEELKSKINELNKAYKEAFKKFILGSLIIILIVSLIIVVVAKMYFFEKEKSKIIKEEQSIPKIQSTYEEDAMKDKREEIIEMEKQLEKIKELQEKLEEGNTREEKRAYIEKFDELQNQYDGLKSERDKKAEEYNDKLQLERNSEKNEEN